MKKKIRKSSEKQKISAMVLKVAEGYIDLGETTEERENYPRSACSAWNIACLPTLKRESAIERYVEEYKKINKADATDCKALEENLWETLIIPYSSLPQKRESSAGPKQIIDFMNQCFKKEADFSLEMAI